MHRSSPLVRHWVLAFFLFAALVILLAIRPTLPGEHFEIGDFAANGILIQDAKHLKLLQGNYSRIGVNHPGPAILYVLAAGELVFHDLLRLVASPLAGQIMAVALYSAFWLALIARELGKQIGTKSVALLGASVFALAISLFDHDILSGLWFPHLYVLPFATFVISLARLAEGRADSLVVTAIATGFAVNGHVSFVSTIAIMFGVVVLLNAIAFRGSDGQRCVLSRTFLRQHRRTLIAAGGIVGLFLLPLALDAFLHGRRTIAGYVAFSGSKAPNTVHAAFNYMVVYWGGFVPFFAGGLGLWLAYGSTRLAAPAPDAPLAPGSTSRRVWVTAMSIVVVAATAAVMFYAIYGVDYLSFVYTGFFFYAVPCFVAALLAICALDATTTRRRAVVALTLAALCWVGVAWKTHRPAYYVDQYHDPGIPALTEAIRSRAKGGRVVLDLDDRIDFGWMWLRLSGVGAYSKRRGEIPFCVRRNWHILFTEAGRCTPEEVRTQPRYIVRVIPDGASPEPSQEFDSLRLAFIRPNPPLLAGVGRFDVLTHNQTFNDYTNVSGWSPAEGEYVWTDGKKARLEFRVRQGFEGVVNLDVGAFLPNDQVTQTFTFNGGAAPPIHAEFFRPKNPRQIISIPVKATGNAQTVQIDIAIHKPLSPRKERLGDDPRWLGLNLFAIEIVGR